MAVKRIRLKDGSYLVLKDGYAYRAVSAAQYQEMLQTGKLNPNDRGDLYFASSPELARTLSVPWGKDDYMLRVKAEDLGELFPDPNVAPGETYVSFLTKNSVDVAAVDVLVGKEYQPAVNTDAPPDILGFFQRAQKSLIGIVAKYDASNPYGAYRAEQLKAIDAVLNRLAVDARAWTQTAIPQQLDAGASAAERKIDAFGEQEFEATFAGIPEGAVRVLTEDAYLDFGKTIVGMKQDASRAILNKRKLQEKIIEGVIQGSSTARTQQQLLDVLKEQGITALRARNGFGRRISVESYTSMLVRTQTMTAYNLGARTQMLGLGRRFAIFPTIPPGKREPDDPCWEWEKKKYVDLLKDPVPPASTHPNCRHKLQPVSMEELKAERPDLYKLALEYFDKTQNG